jgi:hypothetical protein
MKSLPAIFLTLLASWLIFSCEKDDICLEGTQGTPRLIIKFYDAENPEVLKTVSGLQVRALSIDSIIPLGDPLSKPPFNLTMIVGTNTSTVPVDFVGTLF